MARQWFVASQSHKSRLHANKEREWAADAFDKARSEVYIRQSKVTMIDKYSRFRAQVTN